MGKCTTRDGVSTHNVQSMCFFMESNSSRRTQVTGGWCRCHFPSVLDVTGLEKHDLTKRPGHICLCPSESRLSPLSLASAGFGQALIANVAEFCVPIVPRRTHRSQDGGGPPTGKPELPCSVRRHTHISAGTRARQAVPGARGPPACLRIRAFNKLRMAWVPAQLRG